MSRVDEQEQRLCGACRKETAFTARVSSITVWAPGLALAVPMIPNDHLRICSTGKCDAAFELVHNSFRCHPETRAATGAWTKAVVLFEDGRGINLRAKRPGQQTMQA
jgi:hypothetical protein